MGEVRGGHNEHIIPTIQGCSECLGEDVHVAFRMLAHNDGDKEELTEHCLEERELYLERVLLDMCSGLVPDGLVMPGDSRGELHIYLDDTERSAVSLVVIDGDPREPMTVRGCDDHYGCIALTL